MSIYPWKGAASTDVELLQQLAESTLPMWIFDQESLRFLAVNDAALERYGYTRAEFLSRTVLDIRPTTEIPEFLHTSVMHPHSSVMPERWHHLTRSGSVIEVKIRSQRVTFRGRKAEMVCAALAEEEDSAVETSERARVAVAEP